MNGWGYRMKRWGLVLLGALAVAGSAHAATHGGSGTPATQRANAALPPALGSALAKTLAMETDTSGDTVRRPVWSEQIVTASDGGSVGTFGYAVAISGKTALIGTQGNGAYVFTETDGVWHQAQKLTSSGGSNIGFGHKVAIHGDMAIVSATPNLVGDIPVKNAVYVFARANGTWSEVARLASHEEPSTDRYGSAIAISGDTIVVGAYKATLDQYKPMQGAAYLYRRVDGAWTQTQVLTASDGRAGEHFGMAVALSDSTALIGARDATVDRYKPWQGAAYVFDEADGQWTQTQKLIASDGGDSYFFGAAVALDGDTALIGAPNVYGNGQFQGAAYLFARAGGQWTQTQKLRGVNGQGPDQFGISVALSGPTALIGAYLAQVGDNQQQGTAYAFVASEHGWTQASQLVASNGAANNHFGWSVALAGGTALTGAHLANVNGHSLQGAAYFLAFRQSPIARIAPAALQFELDENESAALPLAIANVGDERLDYAIAESAGRRAARGPAPVRTAAPVAGAIGAGAITGARSRAPWHVSGADDALAFVLDDGSYEDTITLNHGNGEAAAIWLNQFPIPLGTGAFTLGSISIQWPQSTYGTLVGKQVNLLAYYDADGDGDPANAVRLGGDHFVTIDELDTFIDYTVNFAVPGDGDIYIGFENSYARGDATPKLYPAAIDTDSSPQRRSWLLGNVDRDADVEAPGNNTYLGLIDIFGMPGNWLIRGSGIDASNDCVAAVDVPWLTLSGANGSVDAGTTASVQIGADAAGLQPGRYQALLCVATNDPDHRLVRVPVSLRVNAQGTIFRDGFETP